MLVTLLLLIGCADGPPTWCADRVDDADCDGVVDASDRCPDSQEGALTDRLGCTDTQAAGCAVRAVAPLDGDKLSGAQPFQWEGDCDLYLLQASDNPAFPPGNTRTVARLEGASALHEGPERYWRVLGGLTGSSRSASSPVREVAWSR